METKPTTTTARVIGTLTVPAGETRRSYETASWFQTFEYPAQTVDLILSGDRYNGRVGYRLEGHDTYEFFPSSFGGHRTGGGSIGPIDPPRPGTISRSLYAYSAARLLAEGADGWELGDGFKIAEKVSQHPVYCSGIDDDYSTKPATRVHCGCTGHVDGMGRPLGTKPPKGAYPERFEGGYKEGVTEPHLHRWIEAV